MNIFQIQEQLRNLPDNYLAQEMQQPTGIAPQYLILTELERRGQMRKGVGAQMPTTTVVQDKLAEMQGAGPIQDQPSQAGIASMMPMAQQEQVQNFAEGGLVEKKDGFFDDLSPLLGGAVPWLADKLGGDEWQLGAAGLMNHLFGDKKKPLPGEVPVAQSQMPMQRFAEGDIVQDPKSEALWQRLVGKNIPDWLKRKVMFEAEKKPEQANPQTPGNENARLLHRIRGPESQGGKDLNSRASHGKYLGPNQMYEGSYNDGRAAYLRMHPGANIPKWDPAWAGSKEGKRPKGYPTKEQWDMVGEGYVQVTRDFNRSIGAPETDGNIYGNFNVGMGNFKKLFKNPDTPIKDLLPATLIEQNKFNPNATYNDMAAEWENRLTKFGAPRASKAVVTNSGNYFYVPEDQGQMSGNALIEDAFTSEDPQEEMLRKISAAADADKNSEQAKALAGLGSYLKQAAQPPAAPPVRKPVEINRSAENDAWAKKIMKDIGLDVPDAAESADDQLNNQQYEMLKAQRDRKARLGYSDGGIVGFASGGSTSDFPDHYKSKMLVYKGVIYRERPDGSYRDDKGNQIPFEAWVDRLSKPSASGDATDKPTKFRDRLRVGDRPLELEFDPLPVSDKSTPLEFDPLPVSDKPIPLKFEPLTVTDKAVDFRTPYFPATDKPVEFRTGHAGRDLADASSDLWRWGGNMAVNGPNLPWIKDSEDVPGIVTGAGNLGKIFLDIGSAGVGGAAAGVGALGTGLGGLYDLVFGYGPGARAWLYNQNGNQTQPKVGDGGYSKKAIDDSRAGLTAQPKKPPVNPLTKPPASDKAVVASSTDSGVGDLMKYMEAQKQAMGNSPYAEELAAYKKGMATDPSVDKWLALGKMGSQLAAGNSPYFAQNFGPAADAGITALMQDRERAQELNQRRANLALQQENNWRADQRSSLDNAVRMRGDDLQYKRAVEVAEISASKRASLAAAQGATPDVQASVFIATMIGDLVDKGMPEADARKLAQERLALGASGASASRLLKSQKGMGADDTFAADASYDPSGAQ